MTVRTISLSAGLADPTVYRDRLGEIVKNVRDKIAMQALRGIVHRTPVDTGRARSNWNVSTEEPDISTTDAYAPGSKGSTADDNENAAVEAGAPVIGAAPAFGVIYISNGLPYIRRLEYEHWSQQAPGGMVRITLDQIQAQFEP